MKNLLSVLIVVAIFALVMGCAWAKSSDNANSSYPTNSAIANAANANRNGPGPGTVKKSAYRIKGTIDDATQEGNVCDSSVPFKIPGMLEFEFKPTSATKGEYTYSGPFNATGSGPYEIKDDGTMLVDGTGCIMGRCATYSHTWTATAIDPATCKPGK